MRVRDIMITEFNTIRPEATLREAAELLSTHSVHSLPVMRGKKVVGILYLSDLARLILTRLEAQSR